MRTIIAVLLFAVPCLACKPGEVAYEGVCAADIKPEGAPSAAPTTDPKIVSAEKPPSDKMPSYQREGIHVDDAKPGVEPSTETAHDYASERNQK